MELSRLKDPQYLAKLVLQQGCGSGAPGERCAVQEVNSCMGLSPDSDDTPPGASSLCRSMMISINDASPVWRQELKHVLYLLPASGDDESLELRRAYRLLDWSLREAYPVCLDSLAAELSLRDAELASKLTGYAVSLRDIAAVVDRDTTARAEEILGVIALDLARDLVIALDLARALARARALSRVLALALAFARDLVLALARALDLARDLTIALARARDRALARALGRALVLALALARDLDLARARVREVSPVALLRELMEMR